MEGNRRREDGTGGEVGGGRDRGGGGGRGEGGRGYPQHEPSVLMTAEPPWSHNTHNAILHPVKISILLLYHPVVKIPHSLYFTLPAEL